MNKKLTTFTLGVFALSFAAITTAWAYNDALIADCEEFKAANGVDGDCECMAEAVGDDDALAEEIMGLETLDGIPDLSDAAKAIIEDCAK